MTIKDELALGNFHLIWENQELHDHHVHTVLDQPCQNQLYTKPEKYKFDKDTRVFLGLVISLVAVVRDPRNMTAVTKWKVPSNITGVIQHGQRPAGEC